MRRTAARPASCAGERRAHGARAGLLRVHRGGAGAPTSFWDVRSPACGARRRRWRATRRGPATPWAALWQRGGGRLYAVQKPVSQAPCFAAFVPGYKLTKKARAALPGSVAHKDAVYNVSHTRRCWRRPSSAKRGTAFFAWPRATRCTRAIRAALMPGMREVFALCEALGALRWRVSGAMLLCAVRAQNETFFTAARKAGRRGEGQPACRLYAETPGWRWGQCGCPGNGLQRPWTQGYTRLIHRNSAEAQWQTATA